MLSLVSGMVAEADAISDTGGATAPRVIDDPAERWAMLAEAGGEIG